MSWNYELTRKLTRAALATVVGLAILPADRAQAQKGGGAAGGAAAGGFGGSAGFGGLGGGNAGMGANGFASGGVATGGLGGFNTPNTGFGGFNNGFSGVNAGFNNGFGGVSGAFNNGFGGINGGFSGTGNGFGAINNGGFGSLNTPNGGFGFNNTGLGSFNTPNGGFGFNNAGLGSFNTPNGGFGFNNSGIGTFNTPNGGFGFNNAGLGSFNTPNGGFNGVAAPNTTGINTPVQGINFPNTGINTPTQGINFSNTGINTPVQGINFPNTGINTPTQGINFPNTGITFPNGNTFNGTGLQGNNSLNLNGAFNGQTVNGGLSTAFSAFPSTTGGLGFGVNSGPFGSVLPNGFNTNPLGFNLNPFGTTGVGFAGTGLNGGLGSGGGFAGFGGFGTGGFGGFSGGAVSGVNPGSGFDNAVLASTPITPLLQPRFGINTPVSSVIAVKPLRNHRVSNSTAGSASNNHRNQKSESMKLLPHARLINHDGQVLWPALKFSDPEVMTAQKKADSAIRTVDKEHRKGGRATVRSVVDAKNKLADYARTAYQKLGQQDPADLPAVQQFAMSLDHTLDTMAEAPQRVSPSSATTHTTPSGDATVDSPKSGADVLRGTIERDKESAQEKDSGTATPPASDDSKPAANPRA